MTMPLPTEGSTLALMGLATAFGAFISWIAKGAWRARTLQADIEQKMKDEIDKVSRQTGEGLAAIRQKAIDVEIWTRDNFVRRQEHDALVKNIDGLRSDIRDTELRLADKIDRLNGTGQR